jgi:hypothetical protein
MSKPGLRHTLNGEEDIALSPEKRPKMLVSPCISTLIHYLQACNNPED